MSGLGLVLTGGGARGAYQAGVLRALAMICGRTPPPFPIVSGISSGAINGAFIASRARDFSAATEALWDLWEGLRPEQVFDTRPLAMAKIGARLVAELGLGGLLRAPRRNALLDASPLKALLGTHIDVAQIRANLERRLLRAVAVSATDYYSGAAVTFYDADAAIRPWARSARISVRVPIRLAHVFASASLPLFFPPVEIGTSYFGDGSIRLTTPLSTAIHLGADRILAIGIRYPCPARTISGLEGVDPRAMGPAPPPFAQIAGVLLNAVFLDSLETDLERMERINRTLSLMPPDALRAQALRVIPVIALSPSRDLGALAAELFDRIPLPLRHLLRGVGASRDVGWDLASYLFFDSVYTAKLLRLGLADAMVQRPTLELFLRTSGRGRDARA